MHRERGIKEEASPSSCDPDEGQHCIDARCHLFCEATYFWNDSPNTLLQPSLIQLSHVLSACLCCFELPIFGYANVNARIVLAPLGIEV